MNNTSRPRWLVPAVLIILGWILGSCQNNALSKGRVDTITKIVSFPAQKLAIPLNWIGDTSSDFFFGIVQAPSLRRKVRSLEEQLAEAKHTPDRTQRLEQQITRLNSLLGIPALPGRKAISVNLISYFPEEHKMQFSGGSSAGINQGDPVIHAAGLVGVVTSVSESNCYVTLITHPQFSVGVRIARGTSQQVGLLRGRGDTMMVLDLPASEADAQASDLIITGGLSTMYPEGIVVGKVTEMWRDPNTGTRAGYVSPAVNFNKIREAKVLSK